jgi:hypothetical protein
VHQFTSLGEMKYSRKNIQRTRERGRRERGGRLLLSTFGTVGLVKTALVLVPERTHAWTNTIYSAVINPHRYHHHGLSPSSSSSSSSSVLMSNKNSFWEPPVGDIERLSHSNLFLSLKNDANGNGIDAESSYSALEKAVLSSSSSPSSSTFDSKMSLVKDSGIVGGSGSDSTTAAMVDIRSALETGLLQVKESLQVIQDMQHSAYLTVVARTLDVLKNVDGMTSFLFSTFVALPLVTVQQFISDVSRVLTEYLASVDATLLQDPTVGPTLLTLQTKTQELLSVLLGPEQTVVLPPTIGILVSAFTTYGILSTVLSMGNGPPPSSPYPLGRYDPDSARAYFDQRPLGIIKRGLEIASLSVGFGLKLLQDKMKNQIEENQDQRALELAELLTKLGPTFSKLVSLLFMCCIYCPLCIFDMCTNFLRYYDLS